MSKPERVSDIVLRKESVKEEIKSPRSMTSTSVGEINTISLSELMKKDLPQAEWLVDGLIPVGLTVLSAQPASYKTWLLLEIARSISSGKPLFNKLATKRANILVVDEESTESLIQQRLDFLNVNEELPIEFMIGSDFKLEKNAVYKMIKYCKAKQIKLITFDSLVRIHSFDENSAVQMAQVFQLLRKFQHNGISVLITHHNKKASTSNPSLDMRGSSDILAAVDCHLSIQRNGSEKSILITQSKLRIAEELSSVNVTVNTESDEFRFELDGEIITEAMRNEEILESIIRVLGTERLNQKEFEEKVRRSGLSMGHRSFVKRVQQLVADGRLQPAQKGVGKSKIYQAS